MSVTIDKQWELTEFDKTIAKNFIPMGDRILCRPIKAPEKTAGGVYIPESTRERNSLRAVVLSVGPGRRNEQGERMPIDERVKAGEVVCYPIMSGSPLFISGSEYLMLTEAQISLVCVNKEEEID